MSVVKLRHIAAFLNARKSAGKAFRNPLFFCIIKNSRNHVIAYIIA